MVGFKDSGKRRLLEECIRFLKCQGYEIVRIKHEGDEKDDIRVE
ncbi:molybdopterin-guanine dinucleotide biosynthesis protein MobB [Staphylococcus hominis]